MALVEDDIDDLLDEVENSFIAKPPEKQKVASSSQKTTKNNMISRPNEKKAKCKKGSDLDDVLNDLDDIMGPGECHVAAASPVKNSSTSHTRTGSLKGAGQSRCFPIYIGGMSCATGQGTTVNQRVCDRLRCTDCDFQISTFDNFSWHTKTDYLFLRNNMPDFDRLKSKLISKAGYRAYACQCKCRSVRSIVDLQTDTELKWVCGKH